MGVLLYECMVGHLPFEGNNPAQVLRRVLDGTYPSAQTERPIVGARWSALLDKALAHAPADRFADANAMREAVQAELARLGVTAPAEELAAWLDDTAAYTAAHDRRMIEKLVVLGAAARKARDPIGAAGDYNRALAHAPDDPQLLRVVAGMNRAEARARLLKRAGVALLLMVGLGGVAFGVGRALHARTPAPITVDTAVAAPVSAVPAPPVVPSASASATARPVAVPVMRLAPAPAARPIERTLSLDLTPSMGVQVSVDGATARGVATGDQVSVDGKAHSLGFTCPVCVPAERDIAAGDKDDTVVVRLAIKPATLDITGDGNATYHINEHPEVLAPRVGPNSVAMRSEYENITILQIESQRTVTVRLHAGHVVEAPFP
jgi:serine/threonine-protein kinase